MKAAKPKLVLLLPFHNRSVLRVQGPDYRQMVNSTRAFSLRKDSISANFYGMIGMIYSYLMQSVQFGAGEEIVIPMNGLKKVPKAGRKSACLI